MDGTIEHTGWTMFCSLKKYYTNTTNDNMHIDDITAYIVEPMEKWVDSFLPINDV